MNIIEQLEEMLGRYIGAYPAFRIKPVGEVGSQVRDEQERLMALESEAMTLLGEVRVWKESGDYKFALALHDMEIGERIEDGGKERYGFGWVITRVPGGWIYTAQTAASPCSVFVPHSQEGALPF